MARSELSLQKTLRTGLNPTYSAATADGEGIDNSKANVILHVKNDGAGSLAVTIETPNQVDGLDIADLVVNIPASEERFIGPFPKKVYNQDDSAGDTGLEEAVFVNTDTQTSVTLAALQMGDLSY